MAFKHYLAQGGVELINSERTQAYIAHSMPGFFLNPRPEAEVQVHTALEDGAYESPLVDDAPWVNAAEPATHRFLGMYPLAVEGIGDSTVGATITESLLDGASVGEARDASRAIRVRGLLVGEDELGVEAGLSWLRAAVRTDTCGSHGETCGAADLRYFLAQPQVCDPLYVPELTDYGTVSWTPRSFGRLTVDGSPLIHRMQQDEDMPGHVRWRLYFDSQLDGARVRWGRLALDDSTVLEEHEAIMSRRNLLPNPTFALTGLDWTVQQGQATRVVDALGDTFARVRNGGAEARTNWAPDPRFASAYPEQVWRSNGSLEVIPTTSVESLTIISTKVPTGRFTTVDGSGSLYVDLTPLGPDAGDGTTTDSIVSFYAKSPSTLGFGYEVRDALAQVITSGSLAPAAANTWARRSFPVALKAGYSLRIIAPAGSATMLLAAPLIEVGASVLDYFDGSDTYDGVFPDKVIHRWTGTANASPSTRQTGTKTVTNSVPNPDMDPSGPMPVNAYRAKTSSVGGVGLGATSAAALIEQDFAGAVSPYYASPSGGSVPAAPGQKWQQRARLRPAPTSFGSRTYQMQCRFFDASLAQIGFEGTYSTLVKTNPLGIFHRWTGAANASPSERYQGDTKRVNRAPNPVNGVTLTGIGAARSDASLGFDYVRATINDATAGVNAQRLVIGATTDSTTSIPVTAGETVPFSIDLRSSTASAMSVLVYWYDSSNTFLSNTTLTSTFATSATAWSRYAGSATAPAGAVRMLIYVGTGTGARAVGDTFDARRLMIGDTGAYFDGSTQMAISGVQHRWTGTANGSVSERVDVNGTTHNRLTNPNFEAGLTDWVAEQSATLALETASPISGTQSARLTGATGGGDAYTRVLNVGPGVTFTFSVDYRTVGTVTGTPRLFINAPGGGSVYQNLPLTQVAPGRFSVTGTSTTAGTLIVAVFAPTNGGTVIFDNAMISANGSTTYFDGSTPSTAVMPTGIAPDVDISVTAVAPANTVTTRAYIQASNVNRDSAVDGFYIDDWLYAQDDGAALTPYFSGATASTATDTGDAFYVDASPQSPSRLIVGTRPTTTYSSIAENTTYGPMVGTFDLRSDTSAVVKISLISRDDGSTLSTRTETVPDRWTRYELVTPFGRSVRIQFEGQGRFEVRDVLVERAFEVLPYFDGDTKVSAYATGWSGVPHRSSSFRQRTLPLEMSQPDSRWRPFIEMLTGAATVVTLDTQLASITPVEEQLEPYERNYHEVSVISGPTIIKRHTNLSIGSAIEVEILFQAGKPWAFSNAKQLDARSYWPDSSGYVDPPLVTRNLAANPTGLVGTTSPWTGPGSSTISRVSDTAPLLPTEISRAGTAIRMTTTAAYAALGAFLRYTVPIGVSRLFVNGSVYVKHSAASAVRMRMAGAAINSAGTILSNTLGATTTVQPNVWTQLTLPSRTLAQSVDVSFRFDIQLVDATPSGFALNATALMINEGQSRFETLPPYFEGYTFSDSLFGYSYEGGEGASISVRTELRGQGNTYSLRNRLLPAIPEPPRPPTVGDKGLTYLPSTWTRRFVEIPAEEVASWAASVPTITLRTGDTEQFGMRIRFHPNPFGYDAPTIDPSSYCGEFIVAYLPSRATVVLNGMTESVLGSVAGGTFTPADHLLYGSNGEPVTWPELTCGIPYVMTVDFPPSGVRPSIELAMNRKE